MRIKVIISLFLTIGLLSANSQVCHVVDRFESTLPISALHGIYTDINMVVPGNTIEAKADSCLAQLERQYPGQFDSIHLVPMTVQSTPWFQLAEYRQFVNNIWVEQRGIIFKFDQFGNLVTTSTYLESDSDQLYDIFTLTDQADPEQVTVQWINGEYILVDIPEEAGKPRSIEMSNNRVYVDTFNMELLIYEIN